VRESEDVLRGTREESAKGRVPTKTPTKKKKKKKKKTHTTNTPHNQKTHPKKNPTKTTKKKKEGKPPKTKNPKNKNRPPVKGGAAQEKVLNESQHPILRKKVTEKKIWKKNKRSGSEGDTSACKFQCRGAAGRISPSPKGRRRGTGRSEKSGKNLGGGFG